MNMGFRCGWSHAGTQRSWTPAVWQCGGEGTSTVCVWPDRHREWTPTGAQLEARRGKGLEKAWLGLYKGSLQTKSCFQEGLCWDLESKYSGEDESERNAIWKLWHLHLKEHKETTSLTTKSCPRHALQRRWWGSSLPPMPDKTRVQQHAELVRTSETALGTTGINWGDR